ncbi:unnamed protein product [Prorocentrum cordatum]|uniref:Uncharacterized protein n=1 Tax=Prorocentrum cordatum TaxID=2364126 RepID=A0ABN9TMQ5_9DINO|nr:unnamed protein product [Polarella glacialis]
MAPDENESARRALLGFAAMADDDGQILTARLNSNAAAVGGIVERAIIRQLRLDRRQQKSDEVMPGANNPDPGAEGHIGAAHEHAAPARAQADPARLDSRAEKGPPQELHRRVKRLKDDRDLRAPASQPRIESAPPETEHGWSGAAGGCANGAGDLVHVSSGDSVGRWSLLSSNVGEVKLSRAKPEEREQFKAFDEAEWAVLNRPGALRVLSLAEPQHAAKTKPDRAPSSRMARRWKGQGGAFSAERARSRWRARGLHDPDTEKLIAYPPSPQPESAPIFAAALHCIATWSRPRNRAQGGGARAGRRALGVARHSRAFLLDLGFRDLLLEPCYWSKREEGQLVAQVLIEVDDLLLDSLGSHEKWLHGSLQGRFAFGKWGGNEVAFACRRAREERPRTASVSIRRSTSRSSRQRRLIAAAEPRDKSIVTGRVLANSLSGVSWIALESRREILGAAIMFASSLNHATTQDVLLRKEVLQLARDTAAQCFMIWKCDLSLVAAMTASDAVGIGTEGPAERMQSHCFAVPALARALQSERAGIARAPAPVVPRAGPRRARRAGPRARGALPRGLRRRGGAMAAAQVAHGHGLSVAPAAGGDAPDCEVKRVLALADDYAFKVVQHYSTYGELSSAGEACFQALADTVGRIPPALAGECVRVHLAGFTSQVIDRLRAEPCRPLIGAALEWASGVQRQARGAGLHRDALGSGGWLARLRQVRDTARPPDEPVLAGHESVHAIDRVVEVAKQVTCRSPRRMGGGAMRGAQVLRGQR